MNRHDIDKEVWAADQAINRVIGKTPALIRPPYGAVNSDVIASAWDNGERIVLWSIDTLDWSQKESDHIAKNVLDNVRPGDVILMHSNEAKAATTQALPLIIEGLRQRGYEIVDLSALLGVQPYQP